MIGQGIFYIVGFIQLYLQPITGGSMDKKVCIVKAGDPDNDLVYRLVWEPLAERLRQHGMIVAMSATAEEGIATLLETGGCLIFVSSYFCQKAIELARQHGPHIRVIVYSIGTVQAHVPIFLFRGMLTDETIPAIFE
jgi:hypothetical protein